MRHFLGKTYLSSLVLYRVQVEPGCAAVLPGSRCGALQGEGEGWAVGGCRLRQVPLQLKKSTQRQVSQSAWLFGQVEARPQGGGPPEAAAQRPPGARGDQEGCSSAGTGVY